MTESIDIFEEQDDQNYDEARTFRVCAQLGARYVVASIANDVQERPELLNQGWTVYDGVD